MATVPVGRSTALPKIGTRARQVVDKVRQHPGITTLQIADALHEAGSLVGGQLSTYHRGLLEKCYTVEHGEGWRLVSQSTEGTR